MCMCITEKRSVERQLHARPQTPSLFALIHLLLVSMHMFDTASTPLNHYTFTIPINFVATVGPTMADKFGEMNDIRDST